MKINFKYIHFAEEGIIKDKPFYGCYNNRTGTQLGIIGWYKPWRQYVIEFTPKAVFNNTCLADIQAFIESLGGT